MRRIELSTRSIILLDLIFVPNRYAMKLGVLISILVALAATKIITSKRKEFFREAASGYSVNAYFCAGRFSVKGYVGSEQDESSSKPAVAGLNC